MKIKVNRNDIIVFCIWFITLIIVFVIGYISNKKPSSISNEEVLRDSIQRYQDSITIYQTIIDSNNILLKKADIEYDSIETVIKKKEDYLREIRKKNYEKYNIINTDSDSADWFITKFLSDTL